MQYQTETLPHGTRVYTTGSHRFGTDALLLARFAAPQKGWSACDLGSGCGILALALWDAGLRGKLTGVELDEQGTELLRLAAADNGAPVKAVCGDIRAFRDAHHYDLVISNPPYFTAGAVSPNARRAAARHQQNGGIAEFCLTAGRLLKDKGRFAVCYPPTGLATLFAAMQAGGIEPKRLQLVRKAEAQPPWLALVEGRRAGGPGLTVQPDLLLGPGQGLTY